MMQWVVYKLTFPMEPRSYIGMTSNVRVRMNLHRNKRQLPMLEGYTLELLACAWTKEGAMMAEEACIVSHGTLAPYGFNVKPGVKQTERIRRKISVANKGRQHWLGKKHSPETLAKLSDIRRRREAEGTWGHAPVSQACRVAARKAWLGRVSPLRGRPRPLEVRQKISASNLGRVGGFLGGKHTDEARAKISAALKGRKHTPEHRAKLVASRAAKRAARPPLTLYEFEQKEAARLAKERARYQRRKQARQEASHDHAPF